ncbi:MAG: peptidoglycan DD-metalloendopeptidase family protein [Candidatus Aminicenantes bacterium]
MHDKKNHPSAFLLLYIILLFCIFIFLSFFYKKELPVKQKPPSEGLASFPKAPSEPPLNEKKVPIQRGMTLTDILGPSGFSPGEIHKLKKEVEPVYDLAKIKAGQEMRIFTSQGQKLVRLEYDIDHQNYLSIHMKDHTYQAQINEFPYETRVRMIWGIIENNLISAVAKKDEQDLLALSLAEIFGWDIDFYTDLRVRDSFKIIFEKKYLEGKFVGYGNILAAEFTNQGRRFRAIRFTYPDTGESDYFDLDGNSVRKEFLKSPIKFARITSGFSLRRLHPIRKVYRPHYGVDYAARIGTPVQATADGTVTFVGWNGYSGRMIKIRHKNQYQTMYLHLRGYAREIRKGAKVQSGQTIGYVGSSGESTGPHLDYRIKYRGNYINPLAWRFKPVKPLRKEFATEFEKEAQKYCRFFEAPLTLPRSLCF